MILRNVSFVDVHIVHKAKMVFIRKKCYGLYLLSSRLMVIDYKRCSTLTVLSKQRISTFWSGYYFDDNSWNSYCRVGIIVHFYFSFTFLKYCKGGRYLV